MSRVRSLIVAAVATLAVAACSTPTAPAPAVRGTVKAPSFNTDSTADTAGFRSGYQTGNG